MTMFIMGGRAQTSCLSPATFNATLHVPNWQNVQLNWTAPPTDLKWCGSYSTRIGMNDSADFVGAARFTPENLAGFAGLQINSVTFVPGEAASVCTYTVYIWQGGSIVDDTIFDTGTLIASEVVDTGFTIYQEYTVPLTTPVTPDFDTLKNYFCNTLRIWQI